MICRHRRGPSLRLQMVRLIPLLVIHGPRVIGPHAVFLSRPLQTARPSSRASDGHQFPLSSRVWILARFRRVRRGLRLLETASASAGSRRALPPGLLRLRLGFLGAMLRGLSLLRQSFGQPCGSGIASLSRLDGGGCDSTVSNGKLGGSSGADVRWVLSEATLRSCAVRNIPG